MRVRYGATETTLGLSFQRRDDTRFVILLAALE